LNGTHPVLVFAEDFNVLGENINTIKNTGTPLEATKVVGLDT
jgi:hypothetical protein